MVVRKIKEKCKDAARMRREKERTEFVELAKLLPLPSSITSQLDKASVIRLTSCYLKMRSAFPRGLGHNWGANSRDQHQQHHTAAPAHSLASQPNSSENKVRELGSLLLQTLDGFVFALHKDGKIMYISETASVLLGLPQIDLAGSSIFDYILPSDHNDIHDALNLSEAERFQLDSAGNETGEIELARAFCVRMKCILPKRNAGLVSAGHKAIHCNGYLKLKLKLSSQPHGTGGFGAEWQVSALVAFGQSLLPTASTEVKLNASSFMFRVNLDLTLYFIEASFTQLLGFDQTEMTGKSLYKFVHASDLSALENSHKSVLEKGQVVTRYYRLMKRTGGCIWVQSHATLVNNPRNMPKPQHIVSVCHVLADESVVDGSCILSEPCSQQVIHQQSADDGDNYEQKLAVAECEVDKSYSQQFATNECQPPIERHSKKLKISLSSGETYKGFADSNMNYILPPTITTEGQTYMTIGSTRRISDDTSSIASSVASAQLASSSTVPVPVPAESDLIKPYIVAETGSYYLKSPCERSQQNLELQAGNSLESVPSSYNDSCTRYEETTPQFNLCSPIDVLPTFTKQIPFNDLPVNYNHLMSSCQDYCSCSSSPDWSNQVIGSSVKCNPFVTSDSKHMLSSFHSNVFHQFNESQSSRQPGDQALTQFNDYTYYVDTPCLIQYHQQVPINNGQSA